MGGSLFILLVFVVLTFFIVVIGLVIAGTIRLVLNTVRPKPPIVIQKRPVDSELLDLEATSRTIRLLLARGELDVETAERVGRCLEARRKALQPKPAAPVVRPVPSVQVPATVGRSVSPVQAAPTAVTPVEPLTVLPATEPPTTALPVAVRAAPVSPAPPRPPAVLPAPPRPRRSLTNVLAAFMEERNILWGELAGGLLIVGCSIALVITLWHSLEELPYFPFLLFASITALLFGAGEYTLHHWKLESTSRGLLVIALLLVPLNLLVLADPALARGSPSLEWAFKAAALLLSLGMVRLAGRDLIGVGVLPGPIDRRWLFMLAVVGTAGSQLLVEHLLDPEHLYRVVVLGCVPVACHLLACGAVVAGLARFRARNDNQRLEVRQANALFVFLGLSAFALFVALGFLLSRSGGVGLALPLLAEPFALASVPIFAGGLLVGRALPREESGPRTAGIAVAFTGLAFMLSAVVLAWPQPLPLLLVCLSNAVLLTFLAFRWRMPYAHAVAVPCLALVVLLVVQVVSGNVAIASEEDLAWRLTEQLTSPSSGIVLAILMIVSAVGAEVLLRLGQRDHAASYAVGSGALGFCALLITTYHVIGFLWPAAIVYGLSAACTLALYTRWRRPALPYIGLSLFVVSSFWAMGALAPDNLALWGFVLALESLALASAALATHPLRGACRAVAITAGVLALWLALHAQWIPVQGIQTGTVALLALTAFVLAHQFRRLELAWLGSAFLFAAVTHLLIWDLGNSAPPRPLLMALLAHETLALLGALLIQARSASDGRILYLPLVQSALLTSLLAVPLLFLPGVTPRVLAGYTLWLAAVWLCVAVLQRSPGWFTAFQGAVNLAVIFAVEAGLPMLAWSDPRRWQGYGFGLGLLSLGWIVARMAWMGHPRVRQLWQAAWPALDRVMLAVLVGGQFILALWGIAPGVDAELVPDGFVSVIEWPENPWLLHAYGAEAWLLLGLLAVVLLSALREQGRTSVLVGLLVLAATAALLVAGPFGAELATASALRWSLALCYLACSAFVWLRRPLERLSTAAGVTIAPDPTVGGWIHGLLGVLAAGVFSLTMQVAILGFSGLRPTGPVPSSIFAEMGWTLSNVIPLLVLTVGLVGHALRERSPVYAFLGGLVANISVSGGYALAVVTSGSHFGMAELVCVGQLVSLSAALWALAWQVSQRWVHAWREEPAADGYVPSALAAPLMRVQLGVALSVQLVLLISGVVCLSDLFREALSWPVAVGSPLGWFALLASLAALFLRYAQQRRPLPWGWLYGGGLAVVSLMACTADRFALETGYYFLLLGWPGYVLLWSFLPFAIAQSVPRYRNWLSLARFEELASLALLPCLASVLLALNTAFSRQEHLWAAEAVSLCAVASGMFALWTRRPGYVWISGLLVDLVGVLFWSAWGPDTVLAFLLTNALGLAVAATLWTVISRMFEREVHPVALQPHFSFVAFAANAALGLVVLVVLLLLGSDLLLPRIAVSAVLAWGALAAVGAAIAGSLWDRNARFAPPGLYILGLAAIGLMLHEFTHSPSGLGSCAALALAAYAVHAGLLARSFDRLRDPWFLPAQALTGTIVLLLSLWMCLDFAERVDRLAGPSAVLLLIPAALAALPANRQRKLPGEDSNPAASAAGSPTSLLRYCALILGVVAAAEIAWACPDPGGPTPWLHRNVLLMVALAGMTALYGVALPRWLAGDGEWVRCTRRFGPIVGLLASLILLIVLVQEFRLYDPATRRTPMLGLEVLVMIAALVTLMVSGVRFAVVPGRDPFGLSERGRSLYVYAVELLLVLLFLHVRLNVPELFRGWAAKYWTIIVMLIAFIGVGLSEFFERRKLSVLAGPLQRTGVFLPLLPLLVFWAKPPAVLLAFADAHAPGLRPLLGYLDKIPQHFDSYAFLWLLVAGLYGLVFWTRRSFVFAVLAAAAGNFALWSLLMHHGIAFLLHPQCWLIPPALIVLAAEFVNRERLRPEVSGGLRYLGISMIYVSSTADLFIAGLGNSVVLPIILAMLALAGVLLGILLQVRAFLFLGISFLFLDVFTMIWYAAVDRYQTWIWWASGIVLGAAILTLFAVFEKRKNDVLQMLERMKHWSP
jgi:hypothetical protein